MHKILLFRYIVGALLSLYLANTYASIDKSIKSTLGPNNKLILGSDFFIPHIPYSIVCTIKNKSNERAYVTMSPFGTTDFTWHTIQINEKKTNNFKELLSVEPHTMTMVKVTGFELNGAATQISFLVQNISNKYNTHALLEVDCGTIIEAV